MFRCLCGRYTNYGPMCIHCATDNNFNEGVEDLEELDREVEEILDNFKND